MKKTNSDKFYLDRNISPIVAASCSCWRKFLKDEGGKPNYYFVITAKPLEIEILTSLMFWLLYILFLILSFFFAGRQFIVTLWPDIMAYSFQTGPSSHDPLGRSRSEISLEVALSILICLTSIFDNFLVVYVVNKDSRLKCVTNIFILNLALTDIFMATLCMPFWVISLHSGTWIFSEKWCQLSAAILSTLAATSNLNMGLIAFNRYVRVVKPAMYSRLFPSKRMARFYCAFVWIASTLVATPPLYGWGNMVYHPSLAVCTLSWKIQHISYAIVLLGVWVNGTTIAIFYSYYKIYKILKESTQNLNAHSTQHGAASSERRRTDIKLLKTSFAVVCTFVVTMGPGSVVAICETAGCLIPRTIFLAAIYLMFTNSFINPIIYGIMNPQFQAAFKRTFKFCSVWKQPNKSELDRKWHQALQPSSMFWDHMRTTLIFSGRRRLLSLDENMALCMHTLPCLERNIGKYIVCL